MSDDPAKRLKAKMNLDKLPPAPWTIVETDQTSGGQS